MFQAGGLLLRWIECGGAFIVADVVRWTKPVFARPLTRYGRKRESGNNVCIGEREITAEVLSTPDNRGFIKLLVRACKEVSAKGAQKVDVPRIEQEIRRRKTTLIKGKLHRLPWSDESARSSVASVFLNPQTD